MRDIPAGLAAHLAAGTTTLVRCLKITRRDDVIIGFTDHDRKLSFDGVDYEPETGMEASQSVTRLGMAVGGLDISGALTSDALNESDLEAGLFDDAKVELYCVNWQDVSERLHLATGYIGEVRRQDEVFIAEVRGISRALDVERGRRFAALCDADLGDVRCKVDLDDPQWKGEGEVLSLTDNRRFKVSGLESFASGFFRHGLLRWISGANTGLAMEVKAHRSDASGIAIELWQSMAKPVEASDAFTITAGCDKRFSTCKARFSNSTNFRGFPHMPGNDFALSYPSSGDGTHNGGSLS
jgi:uncharacterized phage protein (TIGR02218 family)